MDFSKMEKKEVNNKPVTKIICSLPPASYTTAGMLVFFNFVPNYQTMSIVLM